MTFPFARSGHVPITPSRLSIENCLANLLRYIRNNTENIVVQQPPALLEPHREDLNFGRIELLIVTAVRLANAIPQHRSS